MPYRHDVPYTLTYLIRGSDGRTHLFDPGFDTPENREHLVASLTAAGSGLDELASVVVTHLHGDHMGLAHWLTVRNGIDLYIHPADLDDSNTHAADGRYSHDVDVVGDRWDVPTPERHRLQITPRPAPPIVPDSSCRLVDGVELPISGRHVRVVHTPGHTRGHTCFALADEKLLLTGDHVMPRIYPGIGRGGIPADSDPVRDFLHSLSRLTPYNTYEVAPGHEYRFLNLDARCRQIRAHVLRRANEVDSVETASQNASTWSIVHKLTWGGGANRLEGLRLQSALLQTDLYLRFVRNGGLLTETLETRRDS
ncbi:hypothetical protein CH253_18760 [Rhodococcus sp. 06-156-3C]|uniref:MBL fold metallo-hydrolase n=1 Tax=Nocardiaceae TaxID=85025 RepID=UPI00068D8C38|nr:MULTISPECIES: MBL fold metallo-hydrolase [Rhodococcus]OZD13100.1 hypothetical protein CH248_27960 [Rhodococcus sp. 06-156-4a]OZD17969.1 hypothetical protein CH253_18760 [Rhodococcus sp. 06-156-3C]OZD20693.1 hypothetical protein CH280_03915 [Rhodococcus sp. 06-156-4C]OZD30588.1 hypothetical protein CH247_14815 [Rhodococcus sp. 06-156-3b]OZD32639.1 hypothetical protein CH284_20445 [Rhodococcus sp. 06-156-3]